MLTDVFCINFSLGNSIEYKMTPQIQKPAPKFQGTAVINGSFKDIKLEDYAGKYLVIFFYPLDL